MLSRRRDGNQIFYKVADPMYVELCRSVSVQVAGRIESAASSRESFNHFVDDMTPRPSQPARASHTNPLNQKEKASV